MRDANNGGMEKWLMTDYLGRCPNTPVYTGGPQNEAGAVSLHTMQPSLTADEVISSVMTSRAGHLPTYQTILGVNKDTVVTRWSQPMAWYLQRCLKPLITALVTY